MKRVYFLCLIVLPLLLVQCSADDFSLGRTAVTEGRYKVGISVLEKFLAASPQHRDASRAQFFIAKAHLGLGQREEAREAFGAVQTRYKLAVLDLVEGQREKARVAFAAMANQPDGPLAPEARMMADFLAGE